MKKNILLTFICLIIAHVTAAQNFQPIAEFSSEMKNFKLSNFDINGNILYLPLGANGLQLLDISDFNDIHEVSLYIEYEKRSKKKVYGTANCVKVIDDTAYLSYGALGLKILSVIDPTMPFVIGSYYRYQDVYCAEIYENFALLGYVGMGLEIVDLSNLDDIKMISRNNIKDFSVNNIQVFPPYVVIADDTKGLKIFKFDEPFTKFKQTEFTKNHLTDNKTRKFLIRGSTGYLANDFRGLSVLNMGLPFYPLEVKLIKTTGRVADLLIDRNYLYLVCGNCIEVYDIKQPELPEKIYEYIDKEKEFKSLKMYNDNLFASFSVGKNKYGIAVFQVE